MYLSNTSPHNVDYKGIGLSDLGKPNGYVERQVTNWGKQYLKAKTTPEYPAAVEIVDATGCKKHQPTSL